ncbi:polyprenyl synthetase family protein [Zobellia nedashkovskayae]|uniref:polyprenyl synthetase family protein n=1 Tax=Zobellia nedashkovskayae TaxID=2779510 RepID=UPI00188B2AD0|nr:polyprenyl synthetase family protein [Zobellia nedashkovskayae]
MVKLNKILSDNKHLLDTEFAEIFKEEENSLELTGEAMNYILNIGGGGKRIRSGFVNLINISFSGDSNVAFDFAKAIEMIHGYTLIIDDIQDNALIRRGEKACHIKYGVNTSILAASRLFEKGTGYFHKNLDELFVFSGLSDNLHRGQSADLDSESWNINQRTLRNLKFIHGGKTSSIIQMAALGGCAAANLNSEETHKITQFAYYLGLAYQATDDILTIEGKQSLLGKATGEYIDGNKLTYPNLLGSLNTCKKELKGLVSSAKLQIEGLNSEKTTILYELLDFITHRKF